MNLKWGKQLRVLKFYDEINRREVINIANFLKLSIIEKAKLSKNIYDMYKNEQLGPRWRMGDMADTPVPFMVYKDYAWWN